MWCLSCRQDVPGVLNVVGGSHVCPRCGTLLAEDAGIDLAAAAANEALHEDSPAAEFGIVETNSPAAGTNRTVPDGLAETPDFEPIRPPRAEPARMSSLRWEAANWELNEKLRHVERVTSTSATRRRFDAPAASDERRPHFETEPRRAPHGEAHPPSFAPPAHSPYDAPHFAPSQYPSPYGPAAPQGPGPQSPANPYETSPHEWNEREDDYDQDDDYDRAPPPRSSPAGSTSAELAASLLSWLFLGVAVAAFCCGGFLAGWGAIAARPNLEQLGMPIILGGLLALVIGVLPQLFLRHAEEERQRRDASRSETRNESRSHAGPRRPHFTRRRSRDHDRSRDDFGDR